MERNCTAQRRDVLRPHGHYPINHRIPFHLQVQLLRLQRFFSCIPRLHPVKKPWAVYHLAMYIVTERPRTECVDKFAFTWLITTFRFETSPGFWYITDSRVVCLFSPSDKTTTGVQTCQRASCLCLLVLQLHPVHFESNRKYGF